MMSIRIINAPHSEVLQMLQRRMPPHGRAYVRDHSIGAVGLVQSNITDLFFFSDVAMKAADVFTVEIYGTCPQHVTSLAVVGELSAVRTAMDAIEALQTSF
ncbi:BMC domain-containing protein [Breoghania corrubedonensis]|uniref:BMC domain-containing protein n=1 Tax=Breoghania corrubedonensis TaxID=665038 RepID=A0A2T5V5I8_9HYPH|nr:BMC domain-containing protein [Breoghania corrubedonensis]PTW58996.1 BMC domain-containing protein [Breoghania corrubedonensis]